MQIVNGYICMNCCDVDKARMGQDPHQSADQLQKQIEHHLAKSTVDKFGPAVTFGGALQANGTDGTSASGSSGIGGTGSAQSSGNQDALPISSSTNSSSINLLV